MIQLILGTHYQIEMRNIILFWKKNGKTISVISWMGRPLETQIIITPQNFKIHQNSGVDSIVSEDYTVSKPKYDESFEDDVDGMGFDGYTDSSDDDMLAHGSGIFDDSDDEEEEETFIARPNILVRPKKIEEPVRRKERVVPVKPPKKIDDPFDEYHICLGDIKWNPSVMAMLPQSLTKSAKSEDIISFVPIDQAWFLKYLPLCNDASHRVYKPQKILGAISELPPLDHANKIAATKYMESQTSFEKSMRAIANENLEYSKSCHIKVNEASSVFHYHIPPDVFFDVPKWLPEMDQHPMIQHSFMWSREPSDNGQFLMSSSDKGNWDVGLLNGVWNVTKKMMPMGICVVMTFSKNPSNYYIVLIDRMRFVVHQGSNCRWYTTSENHERTYYNFIMGQIFKTLQQVANKTKIVSLQKYINAIVQTHVFRKQEFKYTIGSPLATNGFDKILIENVLERLKSEDYITYFKHKSTDRGTYTYQLEIIGVLITKSMLNYMYRTSPNVFSKLQLSYKNGMSSMFLKKMVTLTVNSTHSQIKAKFTGTQEPGMLTQIYAKFLEIIFRFYPHVIDTNPKDSSIAAIDNTDPATYDDDDSYKYPLTCQHDRQPIFLIAPQYKMLKPEARMRTKEMINPETGQIYYALLKEKYPHPNPMFMSKYGLPVLCCRQTVKVNTIMRMPISTIGDEEAKSFAIKPLQPAHTNSKKKVRGPDRYYALNSNGLFKYFKDDVKCVAYGLDTISDIRETWIFSMLLVLVHMNPRMAINEIIKKFSSLSPPLVYTINILLKKNNTTLKDIENHSSNIASFGLNRRIGKVMSEIAFLVCYEMWNILPICFSEENILNINFFHMNALHAIVNKDYVGEFMLVFIEIPENNSSNPGLLTYAIRQTVPAFNLYGHMDLKIFYENLVKQIDNPTRSIKETLKKHGYDVQGSYVIEYLYVYGFKVSTPNGTHGYFPVKDHVAVNDRVLFNELPGVDDLLSYEELMHLWKIFGYETPDYLLIDENSKCIGWYKGYNYFIKPTDPAKISFKGLHGIINTCFQDPIIPDVIEHATPDYENYMHSLMFKYYFSRAVYMIICDHFDKETRNIIKQYHNVNNYGRQLTKLISEIDFRNITNMIMTGTFESNFDTTLFSFDIIYGLKWLYLQGIEKQRVLLGTKIKKISNASRFKDGYDPIEMEKCLHSFQVVYNMPLYHDMLWRINTSVMPKLPLLPTIMF